MSSTRLWKGRRGFSASLSQPKLTTSLINVGLCSSINRKNLYFFVSAFTRHKQLLVFQRPVKSKYMQNTSKNIYLAILTNFLSKELIVLFYTRGNWQSNEKSFVQQLSYVWEPDVMCLPSTSHETQPGNSFYLLEWMCCVSGIVREFRNIPITLLY